MRRFRLWLARKLVGTSPFIANTTFTAPVRLAPVEGTEITNCRFTNGTSTSEALAAGVALAFGPVEYMEDEMGKKKKRSKAAGKAAAKNKQENKSKAKGGKGAR